MRRILFATLLLATACRSRSADRVEVADQPVPANRVAADEAPPPEEEDGPDDGIDTAMALEEGKLGKREPSSTDRGEAIARANRAGMLGSGTAGTIGHGAGTGVGYGIGAGRSGLAAQPDPGSRGEGYKDYGANAWTTAAKDHLSTFAADVDTASYTIVRRKLTGNTLPPKASVRVEELVNYFKYSYGAPAPGQPFSVAMDMAPSPFDGEHHILRVGVSTKPLSILERKPANLVFLVDVSGSMQAPDKLPLAKRALRVLVDNLKDGDTVALVTYAGATRVVLPATGLEHRSRILAAIEDLASGGGTAMGDGVTLAYREAAKKLSPHAISRVIVLSDGDANIGKTTHDEILATIQGHVKEGVTLSTIGFGMGNYQDETMEQLANKGNGNNYYIDGISAAKRVFQEQLGATLEVVAKDVKLQVDFDAQRVTRYRLIGYENRDVRDQDFRNDKVDAGEIGAGHQVTALYEVELARGWASSPAPLATVRVRHKQPRGETATEAAFPLTAAAIAPAFAQATTDMRFAFAVAAFADVMRGGADAKAWDLKTVRALAQGAAGTSADRKELVSLVDRAIALRGRTAANP